MKAFADPERGHVSFPHYADNYKCCCGTVHVKQGALIIGIVHIVIALFGVFTTVFSKDYFVTAVFESSLLVLCVICGGLLFYGLNENKKYYLIPFLLLLCLDLVLDTVAGVISLLIVFGNKSLHIEERLFSDIVIESDRTSTFDNDSESLLRIMAAMVFVLFFAFAVFSVWWITVIIRCFMYLRDLQKHREPYDRSVAYAAKTDNVDCPKHV